jgi:hypothetical protein
MMKKVALILALLALFLALPCCPAPQARELCQMQQDIRQIQPGLFAVGVPTEEFEYYAAPQNSGRQRQTNWCWAACIQMVLNYHRVRVSQEEIVARCFGTLIDRPAEPQVILAALNGWGVQANGTPVIISASPFFMKWSEILNDLSYHQPLIVGFRTPQGGHACVLTAASFTVDPYTNEPEFQSIVIRDPWPRNQSRNILAVTPQLANSVMFLARIRVTPMQ